MTSFNFKCGTEDFELLFCALAHDLVVFGPGLPYCLKIATMPEYLYKIKQVSLNPQMTSA